MSEKILIIDDALNACNATKDILQEHGYKDIDIALDGEQGMKALLQNKPDLIILDVNMPIMDGFSFLQEIKSKDEWKKIPLIILTGKDQMEDLFKQEGISAYLAKPVDPEVLIKKVKDLI